MATVEQMVTISARRVDDVAREMMVHGVHLTHEQRAEIGDSGASWLRTRLGLCSASDEDGVTFWSEHAEECTDTECTDGCPVQEERDAEYASGHEWHGGMES